MKKPILRLLLCVFITLLALGLRSYAAIHLNVDYDEPVYLGAALRYSNFIRDGQYTLLAWDEKVYEHPALYKIVYSTALLSQPRLEKLYDKDLTRLTPIASAPARDWNMVGRWVSVFFGTAAVTVLTLVNPLAGLLLGIHSLSIKYTSEVYLEALPLLTSLLSLLAYQRWFSQVRENLVSPKKGIIWLALSAFFLGMTAAGKYIYCVVGLAITIHFLIAIARKQIPARYLTLLIGWGVVAIAMFFVFDPYLWPHPTSRLIKTLTFHYRYQESEFVQNFHYPFWQPFRWLSNFFAYYNPNPASAFPFQMDPVIFVLALIGLPRLLQRRPIFFIWLITGIVILLVWSTKWPQYTLIVIIPFCVAAAEGMFTILSLLRKTWRVQKTGSGGVPGGY